MEFKHFSHPHRLCFQQIAQGPEIHCSGCNSPASGSVYTCCQCNFFLHEQCFQATRSINHPSHPSHPLSLFPYPTYPSASFCCNSCNLTGTGFSYSCSSCEFDLHVHCVYTPLTTTHVPRPYSSFPIPNQSLSQETPSFSPPQYVYRPENTTNESVAMNCPNPQYTSSNAAMGLAAKATSAPNQPPHALYSGANQHDSFHQETLSFSSQYAYWPETSTTHESFVNGPNPPQYTSPNEAMSSVNAPMALAANQPTHAPYAGANQQCSCSYETPSFNLQYAYMPETTTHESVVNGPNPPYTTSNEAAPRLNPHMGLSGEAISTANQPTHAPYAGENQQVLVVNGPKPQYSQQNGTLPNSSAQTGLAQEVMPPADPPTHVSSASENQTQPRNVKHFSHHHALHLSEVQEEDYICCSICDERVCGSAYSCTKLRCKFALHKSCFESPREIQHNSHPKHTLTLLSSPPYKAYFGFACDACREIGTTFVYHCEDCKFNIHVKCATLPEAVKREDHEHPLTLLYSSPYKKAEKDSANDLIFYCDVCQFIVDESRWVYYCQECDYGTHLHCATAEKGPEEEKTQESSEAASIYTAQLQMQRLQMQMEMSKRTAQIMSQIGYNLSSLV